MERERELQRERIELSKSIHDTVAQSAYLIGLGIETAIELTDRSNRELVEKLEATHDLSKSAVWELRHPIDGGLIFEGRDLAGTWPGPCGPTRRRSPPSPRSPPSWCNWAVSRRFPGSPGGCSSP